MTQQSFLHAEKLDPRRVGINDDAFLDLHNRIVRALQNGLELTARVVRGLQCGAERTFQTESTQLPKHNGLQPHRIRQSNSVARACGHRRGNARLIDRLRQHHYRHGRRGLVPNVDD